MLTLVCHAVIALFSIQTIQDPICPHPCVLVTTTSKNWCEAGSPILDCAFWPYCNNCSSDCSAFSSPIVGPSSPNAAVCIRPPSITELCSANGSTYNAKRCSSLCYCTGVTVIGGVPCEQRTVTKLVDCDID